MSKADEGGLTYKDSGVDAQREESALGKLKRWVEMTFAFGRGEGAIKLGLNYFANVIALDHTTGLAITTDGVGTKLLVAEMMDKYDTVGIDCIAMNVNDIICVGATPLVMVDYMAVESIDERVADQIGKGLYEGARQADICLIGGETAQLRDMIKGCEKGKGLDLAGACVGLVPLDKIISGKDVRPGDAVIGLASSGLHSNGYSLAREALFKKAGYKIDSKPAGLDKTVGEELLTPTRIYVREILDILRSPAKVKALANITGNGFCNLSRVESPVSFLIEDLPAPAPIFRLIQECGGVSTEEMYKVFNMGVGFCVVSDVESAGAVIDICARNGLEARRIGRAVERNEKWEINVAPAGIIAKDGVFRVDSIDKG